MPSKKLVALVAALAAACGSSAPKPTDTLKPNPTPRPVVDEVDAKEVRGEPLLQTGAVARFYRARGGKPAWTPAAIDQVIQAIEDIAKDGLTPADYHQEAIAKLRAEGAAAAKDLDTLLTDAVAGMVDHARYGRVRPIDLDPHWKLDPRDGAPPLEDVVAQIAADDSPGKAIDAAKNQHFIYRGLVDALAELRTLEAAGGWPLVPPGRSIKPGARDPRIRAVRARLAASGELAKDTGPDRHDAALVKAVKLFQSRHRLPAKGIIDAATLAEMNRTTADRVDQIRVNLERARWVLRGLEDDFVLVNLPAFKAYLIRGGKNVWESRTVIGKEARQTPSFQATLRTIVLNPDWTVPPTILAEDVLDGMRTGEDVITKKHLVITDKDEKPVDPRSIDWASADPDKFPYTIRQPPGPDNVLGRVKFLFPNEFAIYLHDTPSKELFAATQRTASSGCIRLEKPFELAAHLLSGTPKSIKASASTGETRELTLDHPLPVVIVYWTVSVGVEGEVRYANDVYDLDPPLLAALTTSR